MSAAGLNGGAFRGAFDRFGEVVKARSGHPFRGFDEGLGAVWESCMPRLLDCTLGTLGLGDRVEDETGSGAIMIRPVLSVVAFGS